MRDLIIKHKTIISFLCGCLAFIAIARYHIHYKNQKLCPKTGYEVISGVLYCDYHGRLVTHKAYARLNK